MCDSVVFEYPFMIIYCPDKYITQIMRDEAVDDSLAVFSIDESYSRLVCYKQND